MVMMMMLIGVEVEGGSENYEDEDRPMFSLATGKYRHGRRYGVDSKDFSLL